MAQYGRAPLSPKSMQLAQHPSELDRYPPGIPDERYMSGGGRTPSPTPSEIEATAKLFDMKKYVHWRFWARKAWIPWYILGAVLLAVTIVLAIYDKQIVHALTPAGRWMRKLPAGFLIPIGVLFVISFPPLFGHEVVAVLCGVIWGLGMGFVIVAAGTFLGEIGNFYAFKYCCRARGEKLEKTNIQYGCLARVVREGGFRVALIIRLSIIPGHFTTAVFSTCGMSIWIFCLAAFFSLPKQLIYVYVGVIFEESGAGTQSAKDKIISRSVLGATLLITIVAAWWVYRDISKVKPAVIYARRKARQVKMAGYTYDMDTTSTAALNPNAFASESEFPLSVTPTRPIFPLSGSPGYAGTGGYMPSYNNQGPYGETLDGERKSTEIVQWETRAARVADMRGAPMHETTKYARASDDDLDSEESAVTARKLDPPPPAIRPPGFEYYDQHRQNAVRQPAPATRDATAPISPYGSGAQAQQPLHRFEMSDPPVTGHTPFASDGSYGYPPSNAPSDGAIYGHTPQATDASDISQIPLVSHYEESSDSTFRGGVRGGHGVEPTDATFYTAAGSPQHSPSSSPPVPPIIPPVRGVSPLVKREQER